MKFHHSKWRKKFDVKDSVWFGAVFKKRKCINIRIVPADAVWEHHFSYRGCLKPKKEKINYI